MSPPLPKVRPLGFQLMPATTGLGPTGEAGRAGAGTAASVKTARVARIGVRMLSPPTRQGIVVGDPYEEANRHCYTSLRFLSITIMKFIHEEPEVEDMEASTSTNFTWK